MLTFPTAPRLAGLFVAFGIVLPGLAGADSSIEYLVNGARFELKLGDPVMYDATYEAEFSALSEGAQGAFEVTGTVMATDPDLLFLSWPLATAVLGQALEPPPGGSFELEVAGGAVSVVIATAQSFIPQADQWVATLLRGITPVAAVDGIFFSPRGLEQTMSAITAVPLAGTGNLALSFEEVNLGAGPQWQLLVKDFDLNAVVGANVNLVLANDDGADVVEQAVTNGDGVAVFDLPAEIHEGEQIYFVATQGFTLGATLIAMPLPPE